MSEPAQGPASGRHLHSCKLARPYSQPPSLQPPVPCSAHAASSCQSRPLAPLPPALPALLRHLPPPVPLAGSPSPAPMRRAQSSLCLRDETLAGGQRRKLSSRFPVGRSSESFSPGDTPRQRFRQRRPGPLGAPSSHGKGEGEGSLGAHWLLGGGGFPPGSCVCPPTLLPLFWPSWPSGHLVPSGPGVGWGGSIETLAEHEADANGESEWGPGRKAGICPSWAPGRPRSPIPSFDHEPFWNVR